MRKAKVAGGLPKRYWLMANGFVIVSRYGLSIEGSTGSSRCVFWLCLGSAQRTILRCLFDTSGSCIIDRHRGNVLI
ncbi:hypothetical protein BHM03_00019736 [Ensete ventricosum]|uniref:Uncharacterized protein n=1 Tax=Ensete ventricosum TaxID=4639 RepID=A0A445MFK6_ENSVE|nr:hypothetical protein BHM03_00019736 [Ensete ventricosum]